MGIEFYNEKIGVIAEYGMATSSWDTGYLYDTARFAFTTDGFASKPIEFDIPIINNARMSFHFLDSTSFLCFGSDAFVVKVDMSSNGVKITKIASPTSPIQAYPNPNTSHITTIAYDLAHSGEVRIELWNVLGERVETLFEGTEEVGHHAQQYKISPALHGAFFVKVLVGSEAKTLPIIIE